jgi:hypothetical protein
MPNHNVIDFEAARLHALHRVAAQTHHSQPFDPSDFPHLPNGVAGSDDAALVIRLVLQLSRRDGRDYHGLPRIVSATLDDLCADGDPACRLVRAWLLDKPFADQPAAKPQAAARRGDRIFRHNRFWSPNSPYLLKADNRRRAKLISLLAELEGCE